eukprot:297185_1
MIHIFANGIKYNYLLDEWIGVKTYFIKSRSTFLNSLERKKSLKEYLKYDCDEIQDNGDLEHVFKQLLSNEVEDLLNQPLRREFADEKEEINYKENVIKALKKEISYNTYPPKVIDAKFKSISRCNLWHLHRYWDFREWIFNISNVSDDNYIKGIDGN